MGRGSETCLCRRVVIRMEYISPDMRSMDANANVLNFLSLQICLPRSGLGRSIALLYDATRKKSRYG